MSPTEPQRFPTTLPQASGTTTQTADNDEVVTCWSEIGVYGNGTCPELKQHVHCHHCPIFSAAGLRLLNRPLTPAYRAERTREFAFQKETREPSSTSAVLFRIEGEWLALPTAVFQEVSEKRAMHSLPHRSAGAILGIANIRGELLVCVSLGHLLGIKKMPALDECRRSYQRLLVISWEGTRRFESQSLRLLPSATASSATGHTQHILSWENRAVALLDPEFIFSALNGRPE
jgi:chemotaxis-related protein WspD